MYIKSVRIFIGILDLCSIPMILSLMYRYCLEVYVSRWLN